MSASTVGAAGGAATPRGRRHASAVARARPRPTALTSAARATAPGARCDPNVIRSVVPACIEPLQRRKSRPWMTAPESAGSSDGAPTLASGSSSSTFTSGAASGKGIPSSAIPGGSRYSIASCRSPGAIGATTTTLSPRRSTAPADRSPSPAAKPNAPAGSRMAQTAAAPLAGTRVASPRFATDTSSTTLLLPSSAGALTTRCRASSMMGWEDEVSYTATTMPVSGRKGSVPTGSEKYCTPACRAVRRCRAVVSVGNVKRKRPERSVRSESMGPCRSRPTRWRTTRAPATGCESAPAKRTTDPAARDCAAVGGTSAVHASTVIPASAARLTPISGIELAEIFRVELLEPFLQLLDVERRVRRRLFGLHSALVEQPVAGEDRSVKPEGERDAVARARIHLEHVVLASDEQLGEIGVLLDRAYDDAPQFAAEADDDLLEQVVRERPLRLHPLQLHGDRARLGRSDPDGQHARPIGLAQDDDRTVGRPIEAEMCDRDFLHALIEPRSADP